MKMPWTLKRENENLRRESVNVGSALWQLKKANDDLWASKDELEEEILTLRKRINDVLTLISEVEGLDGHVGHEEIVAIVAILAPRRVGRPKRRNT